jgi:hypothetical protein
MYENGTLINEFCATYEIEYQIQNTRLVNWNFPENIICIWKIIRLLEQLTEKGFNFAFELGLALCQKP